MQGRLGNNNANNDDNDNDNNDNNSANDNNANNDTNNDDHNDNNQGALSVTCASWRWGLGTHDLYDHFTILSIYSISFKYSA